MRYPINPVAKPRQTRRDKWKQRLPVMRYRAFADMVRAYRVDLRPGAEVVFFVEMPKSWSPKKKEQMDNQPHLQTPDIDNLQKALQDAVFGNDSGMWQYKLLEKRWAYEGAISITYNGH